MENHSIWSQFKDTFLMKDARPYASSLIERAEHEYAANSEAISDLTLIHLSKDLGFNIDAVFPGWYNYWLKSVFVYYKKKYPSYQLDEWGLVLNRLTYASRLTSDVHFNGAELITSLIEGQIENGKAFDLKSMDSWKQSPDLHEGYRYVEKLFHEATKEIVLLKNLLPEFLQEGSSGDRKLQIDGLYVSKSNRLPGSDTYPYQCLRFYEDGTVVQSTTVYEGKADENEMNLNVAAKASQWVKINGVPPHQSIPIHQGPYMLKSARISYTLNNIDYSGIVSDGLLNLSFYRQYDKSVINRVYTFVPFSGN